MMRKLMAVVIACMVMALGIATPVTASAGTATTAAASAFNACSVPLNLDRRTVYSFKHGDNVLGFGRLVVTATKQYYHRYCVQFKVGDRIVTHTSSRADYVRENGACTTQLGARGGGAGPSGSYNDTLIVPNGTCVFESFGIKSGGVWYVARFMRYNAS